MGIESIDQTSETLNYSDYVGDDVFINCAYTASGVLVDLTGYSATLDLRTSRDLTETPVLQLSDGSGIALDGEVYNIAIHITDTQTTALGEGSFYGSLVLTDSLGYIDTKFKLKLKLKTR